MAEAPVPAAAAQAVERRIVSVLFADLVGFTTLSEQLDAEDVATVQDAYFAATRETIQRYGGVLEKFIGDAAMAVFGAPRARDDDAERAVRAGLALIGALEQLEARLGMQPGTLELRVGVNTGEVVHATSGLDEGRVTGDTVNTAARLQAAARPGTVLIGELTALTVAETIETIPIAALQLKGKAEPVRAWEATGARSQPSREEAMGALRAPMLGRDAELARLTAAIEAIAAARGADRIVIVAPPGVGKSRLLVELAASTTSVAFLRARVRPQATAPYETVAQLFSGLDVAGLPEALAAAGVPDARASVIRDEVARVLEPSTGATAAGADLAAEREVRFDAWIAALDALAGTAAVWLVEDVHWAGGDMLAFLDHAGRVPSHGGRLVVATARPSLLASAPEWSATTRVDLQPLAPVAANALVRALLGAALPEALVEAVVERSDGTPLFIEELLRTWASVGTLVLQDGAWHLAVTPESVTLPPTVQAIYAAQLDDLPPDARLVARRGSVAGRRVPVDAFDTLELGGHRPGLDALRRRAFVAGPVGDPITGDMYAYRHALLRDAGYASLARAERARLHVAMARWLAETAGERADVVAEAVAEHHASALESLSALGGADVPDRVTLMRDAAAWYERAAEAALRLSAHEAALRLFARSVEMTDPASRLDVARRRLRLGETLAASADMDAGIGEMEAALAAFVGDAAGTAATAYALARAYMQQVRFQEAEELTAGTIPQLTGEPAAAARLRAMHAWSVSAQGRSDGVRAEADLAWADAQAAGDPVLELDVLEHVNAARDEIGEAGEGQWALLEERALAVGRWHQVVVAGRIRAAILADTDPRSALPRLDAAAELASAHGLTEQGGWVAYSRTETLWVAGDLDRALDAGRGAVALGERYAYQRLAFRTWVVMLPIAAVRGDAALVEHWERWWSAAASQFPSTPSPYARMLRAAIDVWVAQATGRQVAAPPDDVIDALIPMGNPHFLAAIETVVRAWLDAGRTDLATVAAERSAANAAEPDATSLMRASAALLDAWANGSDDSARLGAKLSGELGAPWWELRALRALGDPRAATLEAELGIRR